MSVRPATTSSNNTRLDAANGAEIEMRGRSALDKNAHRYSHSRATPSPLFTSEYNNSGPNPSPEVSQTSSSAKARKGVNTRFWEQVRVILTLVVTFAYLVFLGLMFYLNTATITTGITASSDASGQWVVTDVVLLSPAFDNNVQIGAIVKSINGRPPGTVLQGNSAKLTSNTQLVLEQGNDSVSLAINAIANPIERWTYALLGLIFIGVGGPVFMKARQRKAASFFYLFCIATASCFASAIGNVSYANPMPTIMFINLMLFGCSFTLFFLEFPVAIGKSARRHNLFLALAIIPGITLLIGHMLLVPGDVYRYKVIQPFLFLYLLGCVLAGVGVIAKSFIVERSQEVRQQLALLLGGTGFAVSPPLFLTLIPMILIKKPVISMEVSAIALGIMPLAFAYAVTQHQLLGVRSLVRRGVVYLIMGSSVLLVFSLIATAVGNWMPAGWEKNEIGLIGFGFFVFLIAFSYSRLQVRVEKLVDKYIYHDAYDYKEALLQFSSQLASEQKLQVLSDQLVERTCRLMNLTCGALLLVDDSGIQGRTRTGSRPGYAGLSTVVLDDIDLIESVGSDLLTTNSLSRKKRKRVRAQTEDDQVVYLETYAAYGDAAYELIEGLHNGLSQLGIELHQSGALIQPSPNGRNGTHPHHERLSANSVVEIAKQDRFNGDMPKGDIEAMRSFLGVPLWTRSRFVGVLCLAGKRTGERFSTDDLSLLSTLGSQAALAIYNAQLHEAREAALLDTIAALAHAIEAKDGYTIHHCENMTGRAVAVAQAIGLSRQEVESVRMGAILHDVGKIGIPDAVLNKPGKLNSEEYETIKEHAAIGARIVKSVGALHEVVPIVLHHQERYDGSGYPQGLSGTDIPIGARIIGVVDTYGAMTEDRVYRKAPGHTKAIAELQRLAGRQFDPAIVDAFVKLLDTHPELSEPETAESEAEEQKVEVKS